MPEVKTYDPKKVSVSVNGRTITGFANDGIITATHNEDAVTPSVGAQGDVTYSENANNSGNVALTLMSTSASLSFLREQCSKRKMLRLSISDANDDDSIHINEENCRILKMPDTPRGREQATVTINIYVPDLNYR